MKKIYCLILVGSRMIVSAQMPAGAMGYWPFDNNALDMSGNGNHGTATNTISYYDRFGNPNMAYRFNGSTSKVVVPNSTTIDMGPNDDFSIAIWEKAYANNLSTVILMKHDNGTWNGYDFIAGNNSNPGYCSTPQHIYFYTASGSMEDACSNGPLLIDSTWHFLVGTFVASTQKSYFYVDGVLQNDVGAASGIMSCQAALSFGFYVVNNGGFFNGVLDGARIYKRNLSPTEILQLYNEPNPIVSTVGMKELEGSAFSISASPNPGSGVFKVTSTFAKTALNLEVYNPLGQLILSQKMVTDNTNIDLRDHDAGIYYLKATHPGPMKMIKLVKE